MRNWCVLLLSVAVSCLMAGRSAADCGPSGYVQIGGWVYTCPYSGTQEPLADCWVEIHFANPQCSSFDIKTDSQGHWSATVLACDQLITASIGNPVTKGACKQRPSGAQCCQTVSAQVDCNAGSVTFPDLALRCGGPHEPPCPSQNP